MRPGISPDTYSTRNTYALLTKREVKMAGYWPSSLLRFYGPRRSHKEHWKNDPFVLVYFRALKRKPVTVYAKVMFCFLCFHSFLSRQKNHRKSFYCHGKYFAKENFLAAPARTSAKFYSGNKMGNPERAISAHLERSGSQSEHRIRLILPACGACHITRERIGRVRFWDKFWPPLSAVYNSMYCYILLMHYMLLSHEVR